MQILIAGGHGKIALVLTELLKESGDRVRSLIRDPDQASDVRNAGGDPVVVDLEATTPEELDLTLTDVDAIVFAAGAGPGSGKERKETVDHLAAVALIEAAQRTGVRRYVMVSSTGADPDHAGDEVFDAYLRAKGRADKALVESGLDYTVVKPVRLTDDSGKRRVSVGDEVTGQEVPRDDVAGVLYQVLRENGTIGCSFHLSEGDELISEAVSALV